MRRTDGSDGGSAFPHHWQDSVQGMSLRDWFAGQALNAVPDYMKPLQTDQRIKMAEWAYGLADAMLAERLK